MAIPDGTPSAEDQLDAARAAITLNHEIQRLPASLKGPLLLTAMEGRSHGETAEILSISIKAVETRIGRARKLLSSRMKAALDDR
ncbi:MAG: hypothetical protein B7Z14_05905 [Bosea sp. 32-68-6]|nr:MAG: hypothetical protein B7Z14_05905 [Bosea sp. 32-68-6]